MRGEGEPRRWDLEERAKVGGGKGCLGGGRGGGGVSYGGGGGTLGAFGTLIESSGGLNGGGGGMYSLLTLETTEKICPNSERRLIIHSLRLSLSKSCYI